MILTYEFYPDTVTMTNPAKHPRPQYVRKLSFGQTDTHALIQPTALHGR